MAHTHFVKPVNHDADCFVGTCPACGKLVVWDDPEGPVWMCPADLSPTNPHRLTPNEAITDKLRNDSGVYSNCGEDFGFPCYERMPLHSACYEKGDY